jgi:hypothetical protein
MTLVEIGKLFNPICLYRENKIFRDKMVQINNERERLLKELADIRDGWSEIKNIRLLVLGTGSLRNDVIFGVAKGFGYEKSQIDLQNDYDKNKRFDLRKIQYSQKYGGILVGPIAHKVVGLGDYNSVIQKLNSEAGYPPLVAIRAKSGELKITKTAVKESLEELSQKLERRSK